MIWLLAGLALVAVVAVGLRHAARNARRGGRPVVPPELAARLASATRAFIEASPWLPSAAPGAPVAAAAIEAALIAREPRRALEIGETALAASPVPDPSTRVWLAWALCASGQPRAALDQLAKTGEPRTEPIDSGPEPRTDHGRRPATRSLAESGRVLASYVAARAHHLEFEHGHGAVGAVPPLITTGDLAVVTLGRGRGGAAWLTGATEVQLSAAQVSAAIAEHREVTARCLAQALDALELAPGFADAAYLAARLSVKAGLVAEARALFEALAPRMLGRPDGDAFDRDVRDLADPAHAVAAAKQTPRERGQRSSRLRVIP